MHVVSITINYYTIKIVFFLLLFMCESRWGRWKDILNHGRFKWHLAERDMEVICRYVNCYQLYVVYVSVWNIQDVKCGRKTTCSMRWVFCVTETIAMTFSHAELCWFTVWDITKVTTRSRASFGIWFPPPKTARTRRCSITLVCY